jgi:hypothetical protein
MQKTISSDAVSERLDITKIIPSAIANNDVFHLHLHHSRKHRIISNASAYDTSNTVPLNPQATHCRDADSSCDEPASCKANGIARKKNSPQRAFQPGGDTIHATKDTKYIHH